jgi:hypothetical protein
MLARLNEIVHSDGFFEGLQEIALDPLAIERIRPNELPQGIPAEDDVRSCCAIFLHADPEPILVVGNFEALMDKLQGIAVEAQEKLNAIREIISSE